MVDPHQFEFKSPELSRLQPGSTSLGVPLYRDVVQINALPSKRPSNERSRLYLDVTDGSVMIKRQGDAPIQVEYRSKSERFIKVFERPVNQLVFLKGSTQHQWTAEAEELAVKSKKGLLSFLYHVYLIAEPRLRDLNTGLEDN